ncbi:MAG TPA: GNAT family N-acetyltransferase [Thermoanaerobaculia bacterium]|nr:GNAT family N-acetyltransferase [Thermoanaerobaculia bacterium]
MAPIIVDLGEQPDALRELAAQMLVEEFDGPTGWTSLEAAREAVQEVLDAGFARALIDDDVLCGWVGGLAEYEGRVWELHPLVVRRELRHRGIGRQLVEVFETEARRRGALTATLGTDDNTGMTSLADADLYADVAGHIRELRDLGRSHPFAFYQRLGYVVTGLVPDANGRGKPDIFMSKRL